MKQVLCDFQDQRAQIHVRAEIKDAKLVVSGQDLGKAVEATFGASDHEYFYSLDSEGLRALRTSLGANSDNVLMDRLQSDFSGVDGCKKLREYCADNSIHLEFFCR